MSQDRLRAIHERFLSEVGWDRRGAPYDLSELPEDGSWGAWVAQAGVPELDGDLEANLAARNAEGDRRKWLVELAQGLIAWERADDAYAETTREAEALPHQLAARSAQLSSRLRAYEAKRAIEKLPPAAARRAAKYALRCPEGCFLAGLYVQRPKVTDALHESLLAIAHDEHGNRHAAWMSKAPTQVGAPRNLPIGCRHGRGKFPMTPPADLDVTRRVVRRTADITAVSWTPR